MRILEPAPQLGTHALARASEIYIGKSQTHLLTNSSSPRTVHASAPTRGLDRK